MRRFVCIIWLLFAPLSALANIPRSAEFQFDAANWLADTITTNIGNILVAKASETITHDADGNLTSNSLWTNNIWNANNQLIAMESQPSVPAAARLKLNFVPDSYGRRIRKIVSTWNGSAYVASYTNKFVYDGIHLIARLDGGGNLLQSFVWNGNTPVSITDYQTGTAGTYFYILDGNRNVVALVSATDGSKTAEYNYNPFGGITGMTGFMAYANPLRFSSEFYDDETDLIYYLFRYYDPSTGRWWSKDLIGELGGLNLTGFNFNDPENYSDLDGAAPQLTGLTYDPRTGNTSGIYGSQTPNYTRDLIAGGGIGSYRFINGKLAFRVNSTDFFISGTPDPAMRVPRTGTTSVLFIYKKDNPNKLYRLDYDVLKGGPSAGQIGWEHNQQGVAKILNLNVSNHQPAGTLGRTAGRSIVVMKWGGRALFVVGAVQSGLEIYHAENKVRAITTEGAAWVGAYKGASIGGRFGVVWGGRIGAFFGPEGIPIGGVIGGSAGSIGGGIIGFGMTKKAASFAYDSVFEKLEAEEWVLSCEGFQ